MRLLAKANVSWLKARHFLLRTLNGERTQQQHQEREKEGQQLHSSCVNMSDTEDKNHLPHQLHHDYTVRARPGVVVVVIPSSWFGNPPPPEIVPLTDPALFVFPSNQSRN